MPLMPKGNAREILTHNLRRFTSVTGQSLGLVFTWKGELSLVGSELFKSFITEHQSEVWKSVACQVHSQERCNPTHEENLLQLVLSGDFICCNVMTLRKIVALNMQKYAGMYKQRILYYNYNYLSNNSR